MSTQQNQHSQQPVGGVTFTWLLGGPVSSFVSKATGEPKTVIELRDPARLRNSLVLFLDGEPGELERIKPHTTVTLRVDEVRKGSGRGELIGEVNREAVETAFGRARSAS